MDFFTLLDRLMPGIGAQCGLVKRRRTQERIHVEERDDDQEYIRRRQIAAPSLGVVVRLLLAC